MNLTIGLPVDCGHRHEFWASYHKFLVRAHEYFDGTVCEILNPGDSAIARARNNITHDFLKGDGDYLLFLDTDLDFEPDQLGRLIRLARPDAIVCGQYALKQPEFRMCWNALPDEEPDGNGLLKVGESGTGCMIIPRQLFAAMKEKMAPRYTCDMGKDDRFSFFDMGVVKGRWLSEDWLFCRRARMLGFPVLVDTETIFGHNGWIRYPLSDEVLIQAVASRCINRDILGMFQREIDTRAKVNASPRPQQVEPGRLESAGAGG